MEGTGLCPHGINGSKERVIKRQAGFTLVELMLTMAVFVLVIAAASSIFSGLLTQFKQQSKVGETNIEGIIGLDLLRRDLTHAGYGLPWTIAGVMYQEAVGSPASTYNDATSNPPKAIVSGNNTGLNGSDYLVIKAVNVAGNSTCEKWAHLRNGNVAKEWNPPTERLDSGARVIVLSGSADPNSRTLAASTVSGVTKFFTTYNAATHPNSVTDSSFAPTDPTETRIIYGVDTDTNLRMPFNRADYFLSNTSVPARCAPNTAVLEKVVVNQDDGNLTAYMPLLDCVADMQVDFWLDTDGDGVIDTIRDDISPTGLNLSARQLRDQLKEVRVYIVAHEGQKDGTYDFSQNNTRQYLSAVEVLGTNSYTRNFVNLKTVVGDADYKHYRWRLYTLVIKPRNLK